ncbi:MAG: hypothetical protein CMC15_15825 [Flavobacteriaceae bacterium]|nr:hypothetical protein [Flavobacteriaceae bacterium]
MILAAGIINLISLAIFIRKREMVGSPAVWMVGLISIMLLGNVFNPLKPTPRVVESFDTSIEIVILLFAIVTLVSATFCRIDGFRLRLRKADLWRINSNYIILTISIVAVIHFFLLAAKAGGIPLLVFGEFSGTSGHLRYNDFRLPFVTQLVRGFVRVSVAILLMNYIFCHDDLKTFLKRESISILLVGLQLLLILLEGTRSIFVHAFVATMFILALKTRPNRTLIFSGAMFVIMTFVVVGEIRRGGSKMSERLDFTSSVSAIDNGVSWVANYTIPNLQNYQLAIDAYEGVDFYGYLLFKGFIPDSLLFPFMRVVGIDPDKFEGELLNGSVYVIPSYPSMTFRTVFADLHVEFGPVGAFLIPSFFLIFFVIALRKLFSKPGNAVVALYMVPGIFSVPLMNNFNNLANLTVLVLLLLIRRNA